LVPHSTVTCNKIQHFGLYKNLYNGKQLVFSDNFWLLTSLFREFSLVGLALDRVNGSQSFTVGWVI